jgi:hypothetical protein
MSIAQPLNESFYNLDVSKLQRPPRLPMYRDAMCDVQLFMLRRMLWLDQGQFRGWACSECAWMFNPSGPLVGKTIEEMKQRYETERDKEFKSHVCAAHPRTNKRDPSE